MRHKIPDEKVTKMIWKGKSKAIDSFKMCSLVGGVLSQEYIVVARARIKTVEIKYLKKAILLVQQENVF